MLGTLACQWAASRLEPFAQPTREPGPSRFVLRHPVLAHLLSNIGKLPLPILGSMLPFWNPTGAFPRSVTPTRRKGHPLVVCCFLLIQRPPGVNEGEATPGPDLARVHSGRSGPRIWPTEGHWHAQGACCRCLGLMDRSQPRAPGWPISLPSALGGCPYCTCPVINNRTSPSRSCRSLPSA